MKCADMLDAEFERSNALRPFAQSVGAATNFRDRFVAIRRYYAAAIPYIEKSPANEWAVDVYEINWPLYFTPIEYALWNDIRAAGLVMYPQFPVGRFFVDFGNPVARVAIECDGRGHIGREAEDASRQAEIESMGWRVYRLTGKECFADDSTIENGDTGKREFVASPGSRLARQLSDVCGKHMREVAA